MHPRWPICGGCCEVAMFSWMGGAHHCVVAEPAEVVDATPLRLRVPATVPPVSPDAGWQRALRSPAGLVEYIGDVNHARVPLHRGVIHFAGTGVGRRVEVAAQWTAADTEFIDTFVNSAPVDGGAAHRAGFLDALARVLNDFARRHRLISAEGPDLTGVEFGRGLSAIIVVKVAEPRFDETGQRGPRTDEMHSFVADVCTEHLGLWVATNPDCAKTIVRKAILAYTPLSLPYRSRNRDF